MSECLICGAVAIDVPERPNMRICQAHFDEMGMAEIIRWADERDRKDPFGAVSRETDIYGMLSQSVIELQGNGGMGEVVDIVGGLNADELRGLVHSLLHQFVTVPKARRQVATDDLTMMLDMLELGRL